MTASTEGHPLALHELLRAAEGTVLDEAYQALHARHVTHYELAGEAFTRDRLSDLFALVVSAIEHRDLAAMSAYAGEIAEQRFHHGYDIAEVQMAFNSLEEAMWRQVVAAESPEDLAEAIGMLSTVVGFGKDAVARKYLSLASRRHVPTLDLTSLFGGAGS